MRERWIDGAAYVLLFVVGSWWGNLLLGPRAPVHVTRAFLPVLVAWAVSSIGLTILGTTIVSRRKALGTVCLVLGGVTGLMTGCLPGFVLDPT